MIADAPRMAREGRRVRSQLEVRRDLLRLAGYAELLRDDWPEISPAPEAEISPIERTYRLLTTNTLLFSALPGSAVSASVPVDPEVCAVAMFVQLPRIAFPDRAAPEAFALFAAELVPAIRLEEPATEVSPELHEVLRRRLFDLLGQLRAGSPEAAGDVAVDVGRVIYELAEALHLLDRLAPLPGFKNPHGRL